MPFHKLPETVTLTHDILLLTAPYFGAPVLASCPAGSQFTPQQYLDGFYKVQFHQHFGYLPGALCQTPPPPSSEEIGEHLIVAQPTLLWPSLATVASALYPLAVTQSDPLLVLGQEGDWLLVQRRDGYVGFLAPKYIAFLEDRFFGPPIGCWTSIIWFAAGFGWAVLNWLGLMGAFSQAIIIPPMWRMPLSSLMIWMVTIAMWCGPRRDPERIFIIGLLMLAVMLLGTFASSL
jgi:hypothetical protein